MNTLTKPTIIVGIFAVLIGTGYAYGAYHTAPHTPQDTAATSTPIASNVLPYGNVTLALGQVAHFKNISIRPLKLIEDSRCPVDVQCIQAGTVRVQIEVVSGMGTSTSIVTLNKTFITEAEAITLTSVTPGKVSTVHNAESDYRFTFSVQLQSNR